MSKHIIFIFLLSGSLTAQSQYKYGLKPMDYDGYLSSVREHPEKQLIDLEEFIPGIILDIRYATANNFTGEKIYDVAKAYARKPVAEALKRVQEDLAKQRLGIKVFDAYRPY